MSKRSLLWGKSWEGEREGMTVEHTEFVGVAHTDIVGFAAKLLDILRISAAAEPTPVQTLYLAE